MSTSNRVTLSDIAEVAAVNKSTVSLALRGDPRVKAQTREHILQVAEKLGYRPDTHLSHLMGYLRSKDRKQSEEVIAYLRFEEKGSREMDTAPFFEAFRCGVIDELEKLGYKVEDFYLYEYDFNYVRLSQVLHHRSIKGVFAMPAEGLKQVDDFDWSKFTAMTMGYRLQSPILNRVVCDHIVAIRKVLEGISQLGYSRPLLALREGRDAQVNRRWSIALKGAVGLFDAFEACLIHEGSGDQEFLDKIQDNQVDCVIGLSYQFADVMVESGLSLGEDCGFVLLDKSDGPDGVTSIDQRPFHQGQMIAKQLSGLLDRNEVGLPSHPFTLAMRPVWCAGNTTRSV